MSAIESCKERFLSVTEEVLNLERENGYVQSLEITHKGHRPSSKVTREGGTNIGGLGEGTLHLTLKNYICPDKEYQEVKIGRNFADVCRDGEIFEIQTRNFSSLKGKLSKFLTDYHVTIVYPVIREKRLLWTDPETGEVGGFRKSPKKESVYNIFYELVYIKPYLCDKNLSFCIFEMAADESKLLCGWSADGKKGAVRLNRVPTDLFGITTFDSIYDFASLLPDDEKICVKSIAKHANIKKNLASKVANVLCTAGVLEHIETIKNEKFYKITKR